MPINLNVGAFAKAVNNQEARTLNDMKAHKSSGNANVDLFASIGASRGKNIIPSFIAAYVENREYALRIAQWARDVRGGAGERQLFRDILGHLANTHPDEARLLMPKVPEVGRWDDLLGLFGTPLEGEMVQMIAAGLAAGNGLLAKWLPRKKYPSAKLAQMLELSPREYRKLIVGLTNVVETQMCAQNWDAIKFEHVPSLAMTRYKKAFSKKCPLYAAYLERLKSGKTKVNAGAVYPYDLLKGYQKFTDQDWTLVEAQWDTLPNFVGDAPALSMVDTSGSMTWGTIGNNGSVTYRDVAISLGLYTSSKNFGPFKDCFLTFSNEPQLVQLRGSLRDKMAQFTPIAQNTNLHAAFDLILKTALDNNVPDEEMPKVLLIFSDMQFDACTRFDDNAMEMIERKYEASGYTTPKVVFWNIAEYGNRPARADKRGVSLVSGASPAILTSAITGIQETPEETMLKAIMWDRYDI